GEQGAAGLAVREAGPGQVDPTAGVELPARRRVQTFAVDRVTGKLRRPSRQSRDLDAGVDEQSRAGRRATKLVEPTRAAGNHLGAGELAERVGHAWLDVTRQNACAR